MEANALHDLTASYALDALDAEDARDYEVHLAHCARCREELASLSEAAAALAYAADAPVPPVELRARILQQARSERPNVLPLRPRWTVPIAAAAAVAACAAVGLGIWAASLSGRLDRSTDRLSEQERIAAILADPASRRTDIAGGRGSLVVSPTGDGALVLTRLDAAPSGRTYEAWVAAGAAPQPAGTFDGGARVVVMRLEKRVPNGASVLVTEEKDGGVAAPTTEPFIQVENSAQS